MKVYWFLLFILFLCSCKEANHGFCEVKLHATNELDSCSDALKYDNALAVQAMVGKDYTGVLKNYRGDDTSKLDFVHYFQNGKLVSSKFYYKSGQLQEEYTFLCEALHGLQKFYYENGTLAKVIPYRYGRTNGTGRLYDKKGILRQEVSLVNDAVITEKNFDSTGKMIH
jgi:antitoxin component YwqK of YwqJK toxin-antitoxin module